MKVSKNITLASNQKTEQIFILSHTIMACNRQTEKVTYDLGCQEFSLLGVVGQGFPNGSVGWQGREESKILVGDFLCTKKGALMYVSCPENFSLWVYVCAIDTTYRLMEKMEIIN